MRLTLGERLSSDRQRSFWLRCFLGAAFLLMAGSFTSAKVEPQGPLHLWRLHGFYMDPTGNPIANVELSLQRDGAMLYKTKTDAAGWFAFEHVSGRYTLHIDKTSNYSQLSREVIVGLETATILRKNTLYLVAGPGACTDDCSSVFTSKYDYENAIRRNRGHGKF
jgi:carboxypeptidase family protein